MSTSSSPRPLAAVPDSETPATTGGSRTGVRRRSLVSGAAWAVPAVVVASPAAYAVASPDDTPGNTLCSIMYHEGDNERQAMELGLGVSQAKGVVPAGTTFYWVVNVFEGTNIGDPVVASDNPAEWQVNITTRINDTAQGEWLVTATTTVELATPLDICALFIDWRGKVPSQPGYLNGGSVVKVHAFGTKYPGGIAQSHQFRVAERRTDYGVDGYTEAELEEISAHTYLASSTVPSPQVYWSADGVTATGPGGTYLPSDFVNARFSRFNNGGAFKLPLGVDEHNVAYSLPSS